MNTKPGVFRSYTGIAVTVTMLFLVGALIVSICSHLIRGGDHKIPFNPFAKQGW